MKDKVIELTDEKKLNLLQKLKESALLNEDDYRAIVLQAANSLATRYNPIVGKIFFLIMINWRF